MIIKLKNYTNAIATCSTAASIGTSGASGITSSVRSMDSWVTDESSSGCSRPSPLLCRTKVRFVADKTYLRSVGLVCLNLSGASKTTCFEKETRWKWRTCPTRIRRHKLMTNRGGGIFQKWNTRPTDQSRTFTVACGPVK